MQKREEVKLCSLRKSETQLQAEGKAPSNLSEGLVPNPDWLKESELILLECRVIVPGLITSPGCVGLNIFSACLRNPSSVLQCPVCEHHPMGDTRLSSSLRVTPHGAAGEGGAHRDFALPQILGTHSLLEFNLRHFIA